MRARGLVGYGGDLDLLETVGIDFSPAQDTPEEIAARVAIQRQNDAAIMPSTESAQVAGINYSSGDASQPIGTFLGTATTADGALTRAPAEHSTKQL